MTGRECIEINATALGLGKREIAERLDEIVAFAEMPDFIDTPVRYYSSGMLARLGFSDRRAHRSRSPARRRGARRR